MKVASALRPHHTVLCPIGSLLLATWAEPRSSQGGGLRMLAFAVQSEPRLR